MATIDNTTTHPQSLLFCSVFNSNLQHYSLISLNIFVLQQSQVATVRRSLSCPIGECFRQPRIRLLTSAYSPNTYPQVLCPPAKNLIGTSIKKLLTLTIHLTKCPLSSLTNSPQGGCISRTTVLSRSTSYISVEMMRTSRNVWME